MGEKAHSVYRTNKTP